MYKKILNALFQGTADQACEHILGLYDRNGFCIVDYLYFANIVAKKLFNHHHIVYPVEELREALLADYKTMDIQGIHALYQHAILDADVVLPDGIALQFFNFLAKKKRLYNLNGTDFCPHFLSYVQDYYGERQVNIILYGTYPHLLEKTKKLLLEQGYNVIYAQDGYTNLDWENIDLVMKGRRGDITILLNARTTPEYPIQELRTLANKDRIQEYGFIVFNQGGTFDFWVGNQIRPPKIIRKMKLERFRRLISDPKRNYKKVLSTFALFRYVFVYLLLKKD